MAKRPAFQFYPGDWKRDTALRSCTVCARGLWIEMIAAMHDAEPYGHLSVNEKTIGDVALSRMVGATLTQVRAWLGELEAAGVFSRTEAGTIYSRRMVRDEEIREKRAAGGIKGGNPALSKVPFKVGDKVGDKVNLPPNLQPTPAVAVAVAVAEEKKEKATPSQKKALPEDWKPNDEHRKQAVELGVDVEFEAAKMRDWATANGERKVKWDAAFRNWLRNSKPTANGRLALVSDVLELFQNGGVYLSVSDTRPLAFQDLELHHPDIWARAGPQFQQLRFQSLFQLQGNPKDLRREIELQLGSIRTRVQPGAN